MNAELLSAGRSAFVVKHHELAVLACLSAAGRKAKRIPQRSYFVTVVSTVCGGTVGASTARNFFHPMRNKTITPSSVGFTNSNGRKNR